MLGEEAIEKVRAFLSTRKSAYQTTLSGPIAEIVLQDLAQFCRAHESTFAADERTAGRLDGRREVWLRIQHHLQLTDDELWDLYRKKNPAG